MSINKPQAIVILGGDLTQPKSCMQKRFGSLQLERLRYAALFTKGNGLAFF